MPINKSADMTKAIYDKDNNLIVDVPIYTTAERLALPNTVYSYFVFDSDLEDIRIFNPISASWNSVGATPTISNDPNPTLGGDLDLNGNEIIGFPEENKGKGLGVGSDGKMKKLDVTNDELEYLSGALSNIQGQLDNRPIIEVGSTPPDDLDVLWYDTTVT